MIKEYYRMLMFSLQDFWPWSKMMLDMFLKWWEEIWECHSLIFPSGLAELDLRTNTTVSWLMVLRWSKIESLAALEFVWNDCILWWWLFHGYQVAGEMCWSAGNQYLNTTGSWRLFDRRPRWLMIPFFEDSRRLANLRFTFDFHCDRKPLGWV